MAGFMLCSVRIDKGEVMTAEQRRPLSEFRKRKYVLVAHVYQGKEIPIADSNGMSDPFCVVRCGATFWLFLRCHILFIAAG